MPRCQATDADATVDGQSQTSLLGHVTEWRHTQGLLTASGILLLDDGWYDVSVFSRLRANNTKTTTTILSDYSIRVIQIYAFNVYLFIIGRHFYDDLYV